MIPSLLPDIASQIELLRADFGLRPVTASEIEFYLIGSDNYPALPALWDDIKVTCTGAGITLFKIEKEKGREQHEISLPPADALKTARDTESLKHIINDRAAAHGLEVSFAARPFKDQPGSGLHIHVHLIDAGGKNVFYKDDVTISDPLKFSIGGLLATMQENMNVFAPTPESCARFVAGSNAPLTVSWGANNRTTAIRLPDSAHDQKRIEHRVAGADADVEKVMTAILAGIYHGLKNCGDPGPQMYGDASLEMYGLPCLVIPA